MSEVLGDPEENLTLASQEVSDKAFQERIHRRTVARTAWMKAEAEMRMDRARLQKVRTTRTWKIGDEVRYWRAKGRKGGQALQTGAWLGLATVLLQQQRRGEDSGVRPSGMVWIAVGTRLLRVAPEHLRFATARERIVEEMVQHTPEDRRNFEEIVARAGPGQFDDLLGQNNPPDDEDPHGTAGLDKPCLWSALEGGCRRRSGRR